MKMADNISNGEASNDGQSGAGTAGGGHKRKIVMLLMPIFLVIGAVVGLYFSGIADSLFVPQEQTAQEASENEDGDSDAEGAVFYNVPEMLVNLSGKVGQKPVYFKINVVLELNSQEDVAKVDALQPRVIDSMQFYLREMRIEELQGSMGTYRLKEELLDRLNRVLAPTKINEVLIKDVLIQ